MALWTPAEITTTLWLDADDASTLTLSGTDVTAWNDKSGNNYNAAAQCDYISTGIGGKPNVEIGKNAGDALTFSPAVPITSGSYFALYVFRWISDPGNNLGLFRNGNDFQIVKTPSGLPWIRRSSDVLNATLGAAFGIGNDVVTGWGFEQATEAAVWMNGTKEHSAATSVVGNAFNIGIFGYQDTPGERLHGYYGEIIFLDYMPSELDRQKLEGYAAHKWGIESKLPPEHPYKAAAPQLLSATGTARTNETTASRLVIAYDTALTEIGRDIPDDTTTPPGDYEAILSAGGPIYLQSHAFDPADWQGIHAVSTAYALGDIAFSEGSNSGLVLECTTAGTTAGTAPTFNATVGGTTSDGTAVWTTLGTVDDLAPVTNFFVAE